jgi:hypothetical protein
MINAIIIILIIVVVIKGIRLAALNKRINKLYIKVEQQHDRHQQLLISLAGDIERTGEVCLARQLDNIKKHGRKTKKASK